MSNSEKLKKGLLVVLSAPSGCGKTSVVERLLIRNQDWVRSISVTTRPPRLGEEPGAHYHFCSKEEFEQSIDKGEFLEWAEIYGNYYGTPKKFVSDKISAGKVVMMTIDVQGTKQVKASWDMENSLLSIFILPPSIKALRERLANRNTETKEEIEKRISIAQDEIKEAAIYEKTVINKNLDQAVLEIEEMILNELKKKE